MVIDFPDILEAFEFVNFGSPYEHQALLEEATGKIYYQSELNDDLDELPENLDEEKCVEIPHKNELNLGKRLVLVFAYQYLPDEAERIQGIFSRKGAYSRYKDLLEQKGMLEQWYEFEATEQEKALRAWCEANSIEIKG